MNFLSAAFAAVALITASNAAASDGTTAPSTEQSADDAALSQTQIAQLQQLVVELDALIALNDARLDTLNNQIALTDDLAQRQKLEQAQVKWTSVLDALDAQKAQASAALEALLAPASKD